MCGRQTCLQAFFWMMLTVTVGLPVRAAFVVKDGQSQAEIVVEEKAPPIVRIAAHDLAIYLQKLSGASVPITHTATSDIPVKVYVGRSSYTDHLGISADDLDHGAFRIVSGENWLTLIGRDREWVPTGFMALAAQKNAWVKSGDIAPKERPLWKEWDAVTGEHWDLPFSQLWKQYNRTLDLWEMDERGTYNAVAEFLRRQGVRWYMPGELGEIVPTKATIPLPKVNDTVRPDFPLRYPYIYTQRFARSTPEALNELMWQLRMGFNQAPDLIGEGYCGHGVGLVIGREETKKAHPEYYALINEKRITDGRFHKHGIPCLSSPDLIDAHARFIRAVFDHFDMSMVSVQPIDGFTSICQCERCKEKAEPERGWKGQYSNYVWEYCNAVAKEVYKTHPDRKVSGMAYSTYLLPPTSIEKLSPNLVVIIAQQRSSFGQKAASREQFHDVRQGWLEKFPEQRKNIFIYDYYRYAVPGKDAQYMPAFFPHAIAEDLRNLRQISLGDYIEIYSSDGLGITYPNLYVTARCWWDADLDIDALLSEYCERFYGPARNQMKAFIDFAEQNWLDMKHVEKIDTVFALLGAALERVSADSVYGQRIALIADYMKPLKDLREQLTRPRDLAPRAVLINRDDTDVTIDGKLDESIWRELRTNNLRELISGRTPPGGEKTRFHIFSKNGSIYMGIVCEDPDMSGINITATKNDDATIWDGDVVEILIETQVHAYYQLAINPAGTLADLDRKENLRSIWSSNAEVAAHLGKKSWTVEMRLPVAGEDQADIDPDNGLAGRIPSNGYPWYFNVCRQRVRGERMQFWAFSPTGKSGFHHPRRFAEMGNIIRDTEEQARWKQRIEEWHEQWEK